MNLYRNCDPLSAFGCPVRRPGWLATAAGCALACSATTASATWSILIADTRTGEIALGSATCVQGINLRASTPVLVLGVGGVTAQSAVDGTGGNRARIFDGFVRGRTLDEIFADLEAYDPGHSNRQYGFIAADGDALTFSGPDNAAWAGGRTGRIDIDPPGPENDIVYSVQGNILTGEPVVAAAEDAVLNTPGDLAEKLMAAMEAAYAFGGDGRCSCSGIDPTGCGAPPVDGFTRTADVGYMLVGRVGDREQAGWYNSIEEQGDFHLVGDVNADGRADVITFGRFGGPIEARINTTVGPDAPVLFDPVSVVANPPTVDDAMIGDIDGDGDDDLVYLDGVSITTILSNGDGTFAAPVQTLPAIGAKFGVLGQFDLLRPGLELAAWDGVDSIRTFFFNSAGLAGLGAVTPLPGVAPEFGMGATPDGLVLADNAIGLIPLTANPDGSFTQQAPVTTQSAASDPHAGDLNGDGRLDFVYRETTRRLVMLTDDGQGGYTRDATTYVSATGQPVEDFLLADVDGDGDDDIAVLPRRGRFTVTIDDLQGGFVNSEPSRILEGDALGAGDLTGDGLVDFVTSQSRVLGVFENDGTGLPVDDRGFAGGDYFLELNVPNQPDAGYDDPVPQLRDEFNAWRAGRVGVPDGSRSSLVGAPTRVYAQGNASAPVVVTATILDYTDTPVVGLDAGDFSVDAPRGLAVGLGVTAANETAPGVYDLTLEPTGETGDTELWIRVGSVGIGDGYSAVIQPAPAYTAFASLADFDGNGVLDLADIIAFITAFNTADFAADLTGDGILDLADLTLFIEEFTGV